MNRFLIHALRATIVASAVAVLAMLVGPAFAANPANAAIPVAGAP